MMVEAFRSKKDIEKVKRRLKKHKDKRLYPMFIIGLNTGLRIADIVPLKVSDFRGKSYLVIKEEGKTGKKKNIAINEAIKEVIEEYYRESKKDEYLFKSQKGGHIVENTAYRLLKSEFKKCRFKYNTGTHSMRKSHGKEINEIYGIEMAQTVLGHDNQRDTLRYIGMEKEMVDKAILSLNI